MVPRELVREREIEMKGAGQCDSLSHLLFSECDCIALVSIRSLVEAMVMVAVAVVVGSSLRIMFLGGLHAVEYSHYKL